MKLFRYFVLSFVFACTGMAQRVHIADNNHGLEVKEVNAYTKIGPPQTYLERKTLGKIALTNFQINYSADFPAAPKAAFDYAKDIWSHLVVSLQTIKVQVFWQDSLNEKTLAAASPTSYRVIGSKCYPIALAEAMLNTNLNGDAADIEVFVNKNYAKFNFAIDGVPVANKVDFASVIIHEFAHGLGFESSAVVDTEWIAGNPEVRGYWGRYLPAEFLTPFDNFLARGDVAPYPIMVDFPRSYPARYPDLISQLTSDFLFFNGPKSKKANSNRVPKLFAPLAYSSGSSTSHFDEITFKEGNTNSLMTPRIAYAEVEHTPGEVGISVLEDIGWSVERLITVLKPIAGITLKSATKDTISWIDTKGGTHTKINLEKQTPLGTFVFVQEVKDTNSNAGLNKYVWSIPAIDSGTYRIQVAENGFNYNYSQPFKISNQPQVLSPVITPDGGYIVLGSTETVRISCATSGSYITYNINDPTEPNEFSTVYNNANPITISAASTIQAKAFATNYISSTVTKAIFSVINVNDIPPPVVTPQSGNYVGTLLVSYSAPSAQSVRYSYEYSPGIPCDPRTDGCATFYFSTGSRFFTYIQGYNVIKMKFASYKNGSYSSVVTRDYTILPDVRIYQADSSGTTFGNWSRWETNQWKTYPDTFFARPASTEDWVMRAQQDFKTGTTQKFRTWNYHGNVVYKNHSIIPVNNNTSLIEGRFAHAKEATVQSQLIEGGTPGGYLDFKDPWRMDYNELPYGIRNRGDSAIFYQVNYSQNNVGTGSLSKGVFLDRTIASGIYYSLNAPLQQTINGFTGIFQNWSGTNATIQNAASASTGVVFNASGATVTANYKGIHLSNSSTAISNTSQRKIVKARGTLYAVYESLNQVWIEYSKNNGTTWQLGNRGKSFGEGTKQPSIVSFDKGDELVIVYQQNDFSINGARYTCIGGSAGYVTDTITISQSATATSYPTVSAISPNFAPSYGRLFFAWEQADGIYYSIVKIYGSDIYWTQKIEGKITGTTVNSHTPSIATGKTKDMYHFYTAWSEANTSIVFHHMSQSSSTTTFDNPSTDPNTPQEVSYSSGFTKNYKPSIISYAYSAPTNVARIAWVGERTVPDEEFNKSQAVGTNEYKTLFRGVIDGNNPFFQFGTNVTSSSINKNTINSFEDNGYMIGWSQSNGNFYTQNYNLSTATPISGLPTGSELQLSNGFSASDPVRAMVVQNNSGLYTMAQSTVGLTKEEGVRTIYTGREGVVSSGKAQFYFALGDITLDGTPIAFTAMADTTPINTSHLETMPFTLTEQSKFFYGVQYGITDSQATVSALQNGKTVSFKVELVDANTGEVLGVYDPVTYSSSKVFQYSNIAYQVDVKGITTRQVKMRLVVNPNFAATLSIANKTASEYVLGKVNRRITQQPYKGKLLVTEYALNQNFPNPFNPTTTINYQIPKDGNVSIKVFDALGREVTTLVNEFKSTGRYSVEFDASRLSSGIYFYSIKSEKYKAVKKMSLIK